MIVGLGTDLIEISRIRAAFERWGDRFGRRIYTEPELAYCESRRAAKYSSYAARFAAKEAFLKALGTGLSGGFTWHDCWVEPGPRGKPLLKVSPQAKKKMKSLGAKSVHVSLTHDRDLAMAVVVLEGSDLVEFFHHADLKGISLKRSRDLPCKHKI